MATKTLKQLLDESERIIKGSDDALAIQMAKVQNKVFREIIQILRSFQGSDFKLSNDAADSTLFFELRRKIKVILSEAGYSGSVEAYLQSFDDIEPVTKNIIAAGLNKAEQRALFGVNTVVERELIAGTIANNLIAPTSIENTIIAPLQRLVYNNVTNKATYNEAEAALRQFLTTVPGKQRGFIERYVTQITRDGINQYQGSINQKVATDLGLDGFEYVGSLLANDSRINCIDLVNGSGPFAQYQVAPRRYRVADLPAIIAIAETRPGWIPGTTPANFFINRGGYNCRHRAIAVKLRK